MVMLKFCTRGSVARVASHSEKSYHSWTVSLRLGKKIFSAYRSLEGPPMEPQALHEGPQGISQVG